MTDRCEHLLAIERVKRPEEQVCQKCAPLGDRWVHLRICQTCGATLCCDSSPNQHMTAHFKSTGHPVVASAEPGERWLWCYVDTKTAGY